MGDYIMDLRKSVGHQPLIMVGSGVMVIRNDNELLLQLRSDTKDWGIPGGAMELGESLEQTARRELLEETGLQTKDLQFVTMISGQDLYYKYPNGDEVYNVIAIHKATEVEGEIKMEDGESLDLRYFPLHQLPVNIQSISRKMIEAFQACNIMQR
ncbi:NUDIX hydrolase [Radiobacillus kanasensis]|uniref:NUDIX hydrolase n=1 Tax=Radiobacillus kanasensis TaxID=2844358 RepID=UPI001E55145F|nr:NUDIX hydrolase [Radiobacillus kanasensis]UFT99729.1 NUDIX hydrolase [Radiobacillus kanasensis]